MINNTEHDTLPISTDNRFVILALLSAWDAVAVFLSGYICALVYGMVVIDTTVLPNAASEFLLMALRTSMLGGLLAPVVLRQDVTRRFLYDINNVIGRVALNIAILLGLLLAIGFLTRTLINVPRTWVLAWSGMIFISVVAGRLLLWQSASGSYGRRWLPDRIALVGEGCLTNALVANLDRLHGRGIEVVGHFHDREEPPASQAGLQDISRLIEIGKRYPLDKIMLAVPTANKERLDRVVNQLKSLNVEVVLLSNATSLGGSEPSANGLDGTQMVTIVSRPLSQKGLVLKALEDQVLATILVLWLLPLMAVIMISIKLSSPGPIFFSQRRHGLNNTEFNIFKFRTMAWSGQATANGRQQTQRNDPRVTRVGRILRRSSLDELPQLFNVLRGEMSLVGPRPHPVVMRTEDRLNEEIVRNYAHRHRVKPGLTGWAQVNGLRGATSSGDQIRRRIEYDLFYIENWSIFFDLKILALTPIRMILDNDSAF